LIILRFVCILSLWLLVWSFSEDFKVVNDLEVLSPDMSMVANRFGQRSLETTASGSSSVVWKLR